MDYVLERDELPAHAVDSLYSLFAQSPETHATALSEVVEVVDVVGSWLVVVHLGPTISVGDHQDLPETFSRAGPEFSIVNDELRYLGKTIATGFSENGVTVNDLIVVQ